MYRTNISKQYFIHLLAYAGLLLYGCTTPIRHSESVVEQQGWVTLTQTGARFSHTLYTNKITQTEYPLHVYLDGDGSPWFAGRYITRDPTPLKPVMLHLMRLDKRPAIYLGRPCYHQKVMPEDCQEHLWTSARYSSEVVDSMVVALQTYRMQHGFRQVRLFGFSGGGTLAMLMASRIKETQAVVTLAGNLDTDGWISHHGYLPLHRSLNPKHLSPLPTRIQQIHMIGEKDTNILPKMTEEVSQKQHAQLIRLPDADHHCCWEQEWTRILQQFNNQDGNNTRMHTQLD